MKKGPVELRADEEEGETEIKITYQVFGRLQHPKKGEIFGEYLFQILEVFFPHEGMFVIKVVKANIIAFIKTKF